MYAHSRPSLLPAALVLALALALVGCEAIKPPPKTVDPVHADVELQLNDLMQAWNMRNLDEVLSHYDYEARVQFEKGADPLGGDVLLRRFPQMLAEFDAVSMHCTDITIHGVAASEEATSAHATFHCFNRDRDMDMSKVFVFIPTGDGLKIADETFSGE